MSSILFLTTNSLISKVIRFFTRSKISHTAICFEINNEKFVLESLIDGVVLRPRSQALQNQYLIAEYEILANLDNELNQACKRVGEPYDKLSLFGFLIMMALHLIGVNIHNPLSFMSGTVCSEFIISCDTNHEIPEFIGLDPASVTPADLYNICSLGASFKKI
jgi:hypothetical protein